MADKPFALIFAAFADPASYKLVPSTGVEMAIPTPDYRHRPGGPGWDDIEHCVGEAERDPHFEKNNEFKISDRPGHVREHIWVRVSPSSEYIAHLLDTLPHPFVTEKELQTFGPPPEDPLPPEMQRQIAERVLKWGATLPIRPISSKRPIEDKEMFGECTLSDVRTRAALRWAAAALGKRSPLEEE